MRAIGYQTSLPADAENALVDIDIPRPQARGQDLLVAVHAISVNPVDTKVRRGAQPDAGTWKVLGWDAAGVVIETGPDTSLFKPGDEVFYAGALARPGTNAEFHLVDERIVGHKPRTLDWSEAAAMPLTAITAWEALFTRLDVRQHNVPGAAPAIVIIGGAGGVGSMAIQLARRLTKLTVIATASRNETRDWVRQLGAHHVLDHRQPLAEQVSALGIGHPAFVLSTTQTHLHLEEIAQLISPQGRFALIDDPDTFNLSLFKRKSVSVHWEFMFTRSQFETPDMNAQGALLNEVAQLVEQGTLRTTLTQRLGPIDAQHLKLAHQQLESGSTLGKITLEGFAGHETRKA